MVKTTGIWRGFIGIDMPVAIKSMKCHEAQINTNLDLCIGLYITQKNSFILHISHRPWDSFTAYISVVKGKSFRLLTGHEDTDAEKMYISTLYLNSAVDGATASFLCWVGLVTSRLLSKSFFRVIYVGGPLKGPQLTTTADTLTPTRYCVLSLILFVNWNVFYKTWIQFC